MYQQSYAEILADSATDAREQERLALDHAVTLLERAGNRAPARPRGARLWISPPSSGGCSSRTSPMPQRPADICAPA